MDPSHPDPIRFDELTAAHGRRRATRGRRRATRGVWLPAHLRDSLPLSLEALVAVHPHIVATGWTAAALHGHPWLPLDPPLEVACGDRRIRRAGVHCRQFAIPSEQTETILGPAGRTLRIASLDRALFDLARLQPRDVAVVALDGSYQLGVVPQLAIPRMAVANPQVTGRAAAVAYSALCRPRSESPMETRLRLFLHDLGLTDLVVQYKVPGTRYRVDLADPVRKIAIEYDGAHHGYSDQHTRDVERRNRLRDLGWEVIVVTKRQLLHTPAELAAHIRRVWASGG